MVFINTEAWSSMSRIVGNVDIPIQTCMCVTMTDRSEGITYMQSTYRSLD